MEKSVRKYSRLAFRKTARKVQKIDQEYKNTSEKFEKSLTRILNCAQRAIIIFNF